MERELLASGEDGARWRVAEVQGAHTRIDERIHEGVECGLRRVSA
jgi:hypothetical protein